VLFLVSIQTESYKADLRGQPQQLACINGDLCPVRTGTANEKGIYFAMMLRIYGDSISGNCLKVRWTADHLGLAYQWIETSVLKGETRKPGFLALNPAGQVPFVMTADGRPLAQSNAIIIFLAEGSPLIPQAPFARAQMLEWMFWEQYSHEPYIAVARFQVKYLGKPVTSLEPRLVERGYGALARMEAALRQGDFLVGEACTLADVSLVAYTRMAADGGFDLAPYPAVRAWITRVEAALNIAD
jgi:glutathione S-transferase